METQVREAPGGAAPHGVVELITVHVNERPVQVHGHDQTGLSIKEAAISQGVPIKLDFVLSIEKGHGHDRTKSIDDTDPVEVTDHSRFCANDDDDNS